MRCCELCNWCRFLGLIDISWYKTMTEQAIRLSPEIPIRHCQVPTMLGQHIKKSITSLFCTCTANNHHECRYDQKMHSSDLWSTIGVYPWIWMELLITLECWDKFRWKHVTLVLIFVKTELIHQNYFAIFCYSCCLFASLIAYDCNVCSPRLRW